MPGSRGTVETADLACALRLRKRPRCSEDGYRSASHVPVALQTTMIWNGFIAIGARMTNTAGERSSWPAAVGALVTPDRSNPRSDIGLEIFLRTYLLPELSSTKCRRGRGYLYRFAAILQRLPERNLDRTARRHGLSPFLDRNHCLATQSHLFNSLLLICSNSSGMFSRSSKQHFKCLAFSSPTPSR